MSRVSEYIFAFLLLPFAFPTFTFPTFAFLLLPFAFCLISCGKITKVKAETTFEAKLVRAANRVPPWVLLCTRSRARRQDPMLGSRLNTNGKMRQVGATSRRVHSEAYHHKPAPPPPVHLSTSRVDIETTGLFHARPCQ